MPQHFLWDLLPFWVFLSRELANRAIVKLAIFLSSEQHTIVVAHMYGFIPKT
jgi:hypothetical protein